MREWEVYEGIDARCMEAWQALQTDATAFGLESVHDQMRFDSSGGGGAERAGEDRLLIALPTWMRPLSAG